ncbi:lactate dehydrogenase [Paenibacillus odorifer]|uniref:Lactate dehydrogenase n=2 Tax=Paenibacillus TaxID=44249 RepID=A0A1R0X6Z6_9BACL|nr:lactate dehydrogenase [Paenibacillus odorifer]
MVLGASLLQLPAILKAKEMGLQVVAVDMDKNAIGFNSADICLEISTLDIPKVVEYAKLYNVDGIITIASDMPMRTVAAVAKELNIVGVSEETALKATNKAVMRECLEEHSVPIPTFYKVGTFKEYIKVVQQFKDRYIVKPADNSGSRGVFLINNIENYEMIEHAFNYSKQHSRSGEIIVEEYLEGPEVSVETISIDGNIHIIAITDKLTTGSPRFVEMGHSQPSCLSNDVKKKIRMVATSAIKAIGINNGPSHTEIIVTSEGPKIVEVGARLGGDNITTHLVPLSTGVDMVKCCIEIALGQKPNVETKYEMSSAIRYFETSEGVIKNIRNVENAEKLKGVKQISFIKKTGDTIEAINSSSDRIGFVIAQSSTVANAVQTCECAIDMIQVDLVEY